jgi:hypothetical protein
MSLILVFIDSTRPLESPCSLEASIALRCVTMLKIHECGDPMAPCPGNPPVKGFAGFIDPRIRSLLSQMRSVDAKSAALMLREGAWGRA